MIVLGRGRGAARPARAPARRARRRSRRRGAGVRRVGVGRGRGAGAVFDEADDVAQGGVVAEVEAVVAGDAVALADGGEHLGLLDGVDAEVGFEVEVGVEHVGRVAGLGGDDLQDRGGDVLGRGRGAARPAPAGGPARRRRRSRAPRSRGRGVRRGRRAGAVFDEADDVAQGGVVAELEGVVAGDAVALADGGEHLGLLDGVDAEVGFEVEVGVEHVGRVAGLGGDDLQDRGGDVLGRGAAGRRGATARRRGRAGARRAARGAGGATGTGGATGAGLATGAAAATGGRGRRATPFAAGPVSTTRRWRLTTSSCGSAWPVRPRSQVFQTAWSAIRYVVAELLGGAAPAVGDRRPAQQQHADLGAEPGGEAQRVAHRVEAALGEVERAELRVDVAEVRHRRHQAGLQRLDRDDVLDARRPSGGR